MGASGAGSTREEYLERLISESLRANRPISIDSTLVIDYLAKKAPIADLIELILAHGSVRKVLSTLTLAEVTTRPARVGDIQRIEAIQRQFAEAPELTIVDFDQRHAIEAAYVRAATGLKLPDAAIIGTARLAGASALIGKDRQWRNKPLGVPYHHMDDILALG